MPTAIKRRDWPPAEAAELLAHWNAELYARGVNEALRRLALRFDRPVRAVRDKVRLLGLPTGCWRVVFASGKEVRSARVAADRKADALAAARRHTGAGEGQGWEVKLCCRLRYVASRREPGWKHT